MTTTSGRKGFDAPVADREEDHLNRWPVAREIYGVATTSPPDWSVRIGVYGEWGSGKTSVLEFIRQMAFKEGHVVVWFNPWECTTRDVMWKAFVDAVYGELKNLTRGTQRGTKAKLKGAAATLSQKFGNTVQKSVSILNGVAGAATEVGLDLLKKYLVFSAEDLKGMQEVLGDRRLLILIDDLDRTNPDLVPEMLFALKEIMNVPGAAFICAFDPAIVGEVLGEYHPGFGNGLKFLEKIIDYPRWLPQPCLAGMKALARADIRRYCPFVPLPAMEDTLEYLPRNPRVLRQYIRLLSLLRPQIERHYEYELVWPVILAANILKVDHPRIAQDLFGDEAFLVLVAGKQILQTPEKEDKDKGELINLIREQLEGSSKKLGIALPENEKERILVLLRRLVETSSSWVVNPTAVAYQVHIAEAPHAVTWKEFDGFLTYYEEQQIPERITAWLADHSAKVERSEDDVYRELLVAVVQRRDSELHKAADAKLDAEMQPHLRMAAFLLSLLEHLVLSLGNLDKDEKRLREEELKTILGAMFSFLAWRGKKEYRDQREKEKAFLRKLVDGWKGDVTPLVRILKPDQDPRDPFMSSEERNLRIELIHKILPRFAHHTLGRFRQEEFVKRVFRDGEGEYAVRKLLLDVDGYLWKGLRKEASELLAGAGNDPKLQLNAVELVYRFDHKLRQEPSFSETKDIEKLLKNKREIQALWAAATVKPLNLRMVGQLRGFPDALEKFGVKVKIPRWWKRILTQLGE